MIEEPCKKKRRIGPRDITKALRNDESLKQWVSQIRMFPDDDFIDAFNNNSNQNIQQNMENNNCNSTVIIIV